MTTEATRATGAELIAAERTRQVEQEGRTPAHDAQHGGGELASAAVAYISWALCLEAPGNPLAAPDDEPPASWPWWHSEFKPSPDPVRSLVKAGALIAAEIDRIQAASDD